MILPLVVIIASAAVVGTGIYLTLRGFKASEARAAGLDVSGHDASAGKHTTAVRIPHDSATTELLKRFFDGKACAVCKKPIPPVHRTGLKPGLLNRDTHETRAWDHIPNENLSSALETELPVCSECVVAESFRHRHPDLVVDRDRPQHDAQPADHIAARP